jgi:kynurenine formamidase
MLAGLDHLDDPANLDKMTATGLVILSLPMKLRGGAGAPARVLAMLP